MKSSIAVLALLLIGSCTFVMLGGKAEITPLLEARDAVRSIEHHDAQLDRLLLRARAERTHNAQEVQSAKVGVTRSCADVFAVFRGDRELQPILDSVDEAIGDKRDLVDRLAAEMGRQHDSLRYFATDFSTWMSDSGHHGAWKVYEAVGNVLLQVFVARADASFDADHARSVLDAFQASVADEKEARCEQLYARAADVMAQEIELRAQYQALLSGPLPTLLAELGDRVEDRLLTASNERALMFTLGAILGVLALLLGIGFTSRLTHRSVALETSNEELERVVGERTQELEAQNEALQQAMNKAQEAARTKDSFLANMSHEIRTPMSSILGFAALLREGGHERDAEEEFLDTIRRSGKHLLSLLDSVLDWSKIEADHLELEILDTDLGRLVDDVIEVQRGNAKAKGLELRTELARETPSRIKTDPTRLRQILLNLLGNSIKFTERGEVGVRVRTAGAQILFEVWDTGPGIPADRLAKLFDPFTQADNSVTRRYGGTGLGLAISARLAEALGGKVDAESTVGVGTVFRVFIERVDAEGSQTDIQLPSETRIVTDTNLTGRVLVVDDGADNRRLLQALLSRRGLDVAFAENGREAVDRLASDAGFDVVLMDMQMPILDGYSATRELREKGFEKPIVALTAHALAGDREKCIEAGCSDYTTKPVRARELMRVLGDALRQR